MTPKELETWRLPEASLLEKGRIWIQNQDSDSPPHPPLLRWKLRSREKRAATANSTAWLPAAGRTRCTRPVAIDRGCAAVSWQEQAGGHAWEGGKAPKTRRPARDTPARGTPCPSPTASPNTIYSQAPTTASSPPLHSCTQRGNKCPKGASMQGGHLGITSGHKGTKHHKNEMTNSNKGTWPTEQE